MGYYLGVDIGGTFTDCVAVDGAGRIFHAKVPSTHGTSTVDGVMAGLGLALTWRHQPRTAPIEASPATERRVVTWIGALAALTGVIVIGLTFISYAAQQQIFEDRADPV